MRPSLTTVDAGLRISGPTPLPPEVRQAGSRQMMSHRSTDFRKVLTEVTEKLQPIFGTSRRVLLFTASGTGGLEAAVVNTVKPGGRVLVLGAGHFSERFAEVAAAHGAVLRSRQLPWGEAVGPEEARAEMKRARFDAVLLTHNETSTGVINPVGEICEEVRRHSDAMILIDAVSSAGAAPVLIDEWQADVVVGVTQKALMAPPGLALLAISDRVLERGSRCGISRFYFDVGRMAEAVSSGTTTYTPAVSVVFALREALRLLESEGLENAFARHVRLADLCRAQLGDLGLKLVATPQNRSPTVTAARLPGDRGATQARERLAREHGVQIANGRGPWKDSVLRIGHMGYVDNEAVEATIRSIASVMAGGRV